MRIYVDQVVEAKVRDVKICGELLVLTEPVSYLGDIDVGMGVVKGKYSLAGKIFVIPNAVGSTVGSYVIYGLSREGKAPVAMVLASVDPVTIVGSIIANIPLYRLKGKDTLNVLKQFNGRQACIEGDAIVIAEKEGSIHCA